MTKKYLHMCSMGINRSLTSARIARDIAKERGLDIEMEVKGFDNLQLGLSAETMKKYFDKYDNNCYGRLYAEGFN